jgi:hypothetical protein
MDWAKTQALILSSKKMNNSILSPTNNEDIFKREVFEVLLPMSENSNIFDKNKFDVKVNPPDEYGVRFVVIRFKKKNNGLHPFLQDTSK